jgi:hypothetical protein
MEIKHFLVEELTDHILEVTEKKNQSYIVDHPYITSAHFWTFSDPSTYPTSAKIAIFLTPPTQSLC